MFGFVRFPVEESVKIWEEGYWFFGQDDETKYHQFGIFMYSEQHKFVLEGGGYKYKLIGCKLLGKQFSIGEW